MESEKWFLLVLRDLKKYFLYTIVIIVSISIIYLFVIIVVVNFALTRGLQKDFVTMCDNYL